MLRYIIIIIYEEPTGQKDMKEKRAASLSEGLSHLRERYWASVVRDLSISKVSRQIIKSRKLVDLFFSVCPIKLQIDSTFLNLDRIKRIVFEEFPFV